MFTNYLKIAWRNLIHQKGYSAINIGGLAVGMAVAMLIGMWIYDEVTFDRFHQNYDRIAQVMQNATMNGHKGTDVSIPFPLHAELKSKYGSYFEYLIPASWQEIGRAHV